MDGKLRPRFIKQWTKYFPGAGLPVVFFYSDDPGDAEPPAPFRGHHCFIGELKKVCEGKSLAFSAKSIGCSGGLRYLGFTQKLMPNFEYFLSYGIAGTLEGERYKKTPELVKEFIKVQRPFKAPAKYVIFKRWDNLSEAEEPAVVIFFAPPDVLSGLFTLVNFDEPEPYGVIAPFCSGCSSIVYYPLKELESERPRAILGMFDVSARPCVHPGTLTMAIPWTKFARMVDNMDESFLITGSWRKVRKRIKG
jgi:hypothetical protein